MCNKFEIVESFRIEQEIRIKKSTVKSYCSDINIFLTDLGVEINSTNEEQILKELDKVIGFNKIQKIIEWYRKRIELPRDDKLKLSYSTVNRRIFALKVFGDFLYKIGVCKKNPFQGINPFPQYEVEANIKHHDSLSLEEIRKLIKTIDKMEKNNLKKSRLKFIISMMTNCGNRISELINLTFDQIEGTKDGIMINYIGKNATKMGVDKRVPITGKAREYYLEYLKERNKIIDKIKENNCEKFVIVSDKGRKYKPDRVNDALKKFCFMANIDLKERKITNHGFRGRCRTTLNIDKKIGESVIKLIGGWKMNTVENAYIQGKVSDKDKMEICDIL